jgi:pimeloyl-ACP methyl ester carboxylesterase/membrane protein DedA with SNARE-associated domain
LFPSSSLSFSLPAWIPKRKRWRLLGLFLALLALSRLWCWLVPPFGASRPGQVATDVQVFDDDGEPTGGNTTLYYQDLPPPGRRDAPVLVLLHGSLYRAGAFDGLIQELRPYFRLIVPDLPGFGASVGPNLPDYSPATEAHELEGLLDHLRLERVHLAGFGMGGAVALEMADRAPERVQSITLIDSTGTVEFEWLGDPVLNHAIYGAQLSLYNTAHALLPHFGWLDTGPLNLASARSLWDSDPLRLRDVLKRYRNPLLIIQAQHDFVEQLSSAQENYRVVPQSRLVTIPGGHWAALHSPELVAPAIHEFVEQAEHGLERDKSQADPVRLAASVRDVVVSGPRSRTYEALLLLVISVLTMFGEDATCIGAGLLVARGVLGFGPALGACLLGIVAGNVLYYVAGWRYGRPVLQHPLFRWAIKESDLHRMTTLFNRRGTWIVFLSRFVPGSRLPVFMSAGILRFSFWRMLGALVVSNLLWTPLFIKAASWLGQGMIAMVEHYEKAALFIVVITVVVVLAAIHIVQPLCTWRGRRLWRARWRRLTQWEFWPAALAQWRLVPALWKLGRQSGGFLVFTCANPDFPSGGFIGAAKSVWLRALIDAHPAVPRWTVLPAAPAASMVTAAHRAVTLDAWRAEVGAAWPVVLKRDVGGQGLGVLICHSHEEAVRYFVDNLSAVVVQEYVPGAEFAVWFAREPGARAGRILAVAEAQFPTVVGDGQRTLERLILSDDCALSRGRIYLDKFAARVADIPAAGQVIALSELAQPSDGAYALDATAELATPELCAAINALARHLSDFHFGKFQVRCPSREDFRTGQNLRIIGVAGVKAAGSAIRDPRRTLADACAQTRLQWETCFAIGTVLYRRGIKPARWKTVLRGWFRARYGS